MEFRELSDEQWQFIQPGGGSRSGRSEGYGRGCGNGSSSWATERAG
jgi:hypothetical protein